MSGQDPSAVPQQHDLPGADAGEESVSEGPGARLMAERRAQSLSLGDIARQLKLSVRQVEALERDDYDAFAGMVFVRGFLRNYAKLLQLDPEPLLALTHPATPVAQAPLAPVTHTRESSGPRLSLPGRGWVFAAIVLVVLVVAAIFENRRSQPPALAPSLPPAPLATNPQVAEAPPAGSTTTARAPAEPLPAAESPAPRPAASTPTAAPNIPTAPVRIAPGAPIASDPTGIPAVVTAPTQGTATSSAPVTAEQQLRLVFEGPAWVEIKDGSGVVIFSQLNDSGTERMVKGRPPLALVIGNAHAVRLTYRDRSVDLAPHTRVDVARLVLE